MARLDLLGSDRPFIQLPELLDHPLVASKIFLTVNKHDRKPRGVTSEIHKVFFKGEKYL